MNQSKWINMRQAIELSRKSRSTINRWLKSGAIKGQKTGERKNSQVLIDRASLTKMLISDITMNQSRMTQVDTTNEYIRTNEWKDKYIKKIENENERMIKRIDKLESENKEILLKLEKERDRNRELTEKLISLERELAGRQGIRGLLKSFFK